MGPHMNQTSPKTSQRRVQSTESVMLDCDHILTYAGGDCGQLVLLCANFLHELPVHLLTLRKALERRENFTAERAVQRLSNCLLIFGSCPVSESADALTTALRRDQRRRVLSVWKQLQGQLEVLVPQVQRLMLEVSNPPGSVQ